MKGLVQNKRLKFYLCLFVVFLPTFNLIIDDILFLGIELDEISQVSYSVFTLLVLPVACFIFARKIFGVTYSDIGLDARRIISNKFPFMVVQKEVLQLVFIYFVIRLFFSYVIPIFIPGHETVTRCLNESILCGMPYAFYVYISAGIVEEIFYVGLVYYFVFKYVGEYKIGVFIILSSAIYFLAHQHYTLNSSIPLAVIAAINAYLYTHFKKLEPLIISHIIWNIMTIYL